MSHSKAIEYTGIGTIVKRKLARAGRSQCVFIRLLHASGLKVFPYRTCAERRSLVECHVEVLGWIRPAFLASAYAFAKSRGGLREMMVKKNTVVKNTFFCYNTTLWSIMNNYGMEERV